VSRQRLDTDRSLSSEGALVTGSDRPGGGDANGEKPPQPPLLTAARTEKLELLIAKRLQQGYWVESQGDTEACSSPSALAAGSAGSARAERTPARPSRLTSRATPSSRCSRSAATEPSARAHVVDQRLRPLALR